MWQAMLGHLEEFIHFNHRVPNCRSEDATERSLGVWFNRQLQNRKGDQRIEIDRFLHAEWFADLQNRLIDKLHQIESFVSENKRKPRSDAPNPSERVMAGWLDTLFSIRHSDWEGDGRELVPRSAKCSQAFDALIVRNLSLFEEDLL